MQKLKNQRGVALIFEIVLILLVVAVVGFVLINAKTGGKLANKLTNGQTDIWGQPCKGDGTINLTTSPIDPANIQTVAPMGEMVGGHVTPIDHMYFYPKPSPGNRFAYEVRAPADGLINSVQHRGQQTDAPADARPGSDEYRLQFTHTCEFSTYMDLVTKLAPDLRAKVGNLGNGNSVSLNFPVKAGQLIGYIGNQSLDVAAFRKSQRLPFINPDSYKGEAWKEHVVPYLDYFSGPVKAQLLALDVRLAEPRSGVICYDKDGFAIGNWFAQGSGGYSGSGMGQAGYWAGHLAIVYDAVDTTAVTVSLGSYNGGDAQQFAVVGNSPDPATITQSSGLVKYQIGPRDWIRPDGSKWDNSSVAPGLKMIPQNVVGTVLLQMTGKRTLKLEAFPGKTPAQVTGFDGSAKIYER